MPDAPAIVRWQQRREQLAAASAEQRAGLLAEQARVVRVAILQTVQRAGLGHVGGDLSVADILVTLFEGVLRVDPHRADWPARDRFILSKGHCAAALYSTLANCGYFADARLAHFAAPLSPLNGHPNRVKTPGVETNTGPLGHGLPVAVGSAIASQLTAGHWRTFVVLGDGELQEGSNWEAAMCAAHRRLDSLTAIVDRNRLQQGALVSDTNEIEPLADKWAAFGWQVRVVDGHSHAALFDALTAQRSGRPLAIIANTVKGRGVSFMENGVEWHHKVPSAAQYTSAVQELAR